MKKFTQTIATAIFASFAIMAMLSVGMWHWMSIDAMHHGDHECCDFVPIEASATANNAFIFSPDFLATTAAALTYKPALIAAQSPSRTTVVVQGYNQSFLKGVVQRE